MGEVMLSVELAGANHARRQAFHQALQGRRWEPVADLAGVYVCHFEHGFIGEVRRIVHQDVFAAGQRSRVQRWRAAHVWSAAGHERLDDLQREDERASIRRAGRAREVWTDGGEPVGPIADVLLVLSPPKNPRPVADALAARGWQRVPDFAATFRHRFDLGMFEPLGPRIAADVRAAGPTSGLGAWAASTFDCERIQGPPQPREVRTLPWDTER